jgi:hypothetical protein
MLQWKVRRLMSIPNPLINILGNWQATNRLWLVPDVPVRESAATAKVTSAAKGRFLNIAYTWDEAGPQDGLLLIGQVPQSDQVSAGWVDSWHNGDRLMSCVGSLTAEGAFSVKGAYPAPPGPDWGWRIDVTPGVGDETWSLTMYNITPEKDEFLAVEAVFSRQT